MQCEEENTFWYTNISHNICMHVKSFGTKYNHVTSVAQEIRI